MRNTLTLGTLLLFSGLAFSQSSGQLQIYASGGIAIPWSANDCSKYYSVDTAFSAAGLPVFKYSDTWSTGFHFGFGLGYELTPDVSVILDLNYNSSNLNKAQLLKDLGLSPDKYVADATMKMVAINVNVKYDISQLGLFFDPYVTVGAGFVGIDADDISVLSSASTVIAASFKSQSALNTSVGIGLDFPGVASSSFFVEVKYDVSYTRSASPFSGDNFSIVPVRLGIRGSF